MLYTMREILTVFIVILEFIGYKPYVRDVLRGKTHPHAFSWLIWGLVTTIAFGLQISHGGGVGSYVTLAAAFIGFFVFGLALRSGKRDITRLDVVFFVLALVAMIIWLVAKQPLLSVILLCITDLLGFAPTVRKSWHRPDQETLSTYALGSFRHALSIVALSHYTLITALYPAVWVIANGSFSAMLVVRRRSKIDYTSIHAS